MQTRPLNASSSLSLSGQSHQAESSKKDCLEKENRVKGEKRGEAQPETGDSRGPTPSLVQAPARHTHLGEAVFSEDM